MAMAFTAWLRAPAPTTCTSTAPDWRTTPAMAPATELGFERLDTLRISTGPPDGRDASVLGSSTAPLTLPAHRFVPFLHVCRTHAARSTPRSAVGRKWPSVEGDGLVVGVGLGVAVGLRVRRWRQTCCLADALGDLDHDLEVLGQEGLGVLPPLPELFALVGEPRPRLLHQPEVDPHVDQRALPADALAVRDIELCLAEGRRT